jgi:hypothetical protein
VRLGLLLCLPLAFYACYAADEDLQAIQRVLRKRDSSLDWFHVLAKKPVNATHSVMVVEAAPVSKGSPVWPEMQIGVFVVSGTDNRVRVILDTYPLRDVIATPALDEPTEHAAYLHFYSDYGMYHGSIKYIYDLSSGTPVQKIRYGILALTSSRRENGKLHYMASFGRAGQVQEGWSERHAIITIEPGNGDSLPGFNIVSTPAQENIYEQPITLEASDGESVIIANKTPPGQPHHPSGIYVVGKSGAKHLFAAPIPTTDFYHKMQPGKQSPVEISSDIGPFVLSGTKLWFASTFYDGEGESGLGAIGTFDIPACKYQMRYLPEIVGWSGSAILLHGDDLWIGLMRRPEGASYGGGLLRYNTKTGSARKYALPDVIYTIDRLGDTLYCGTSHGLYLVRDDKLTQLRFEPDGKGKLSMVAREVRSESMAADEHR